MSLADKIMRKLYGGSARSHGIGYGGLAAESVDTITGVGVHNGIVCGLQGPGDIECEFGSAPKEQQWPEVMRLARQFYAESLATDGGSTKEQREARALNAQAYNAMLPQILARAGQFAGAPQKLAAIRDVLRAHVNYVNDPMGKDSVRQIGALYSRGYGDCVSLTIAMSALAQKAYGFGSQWILGGDSGDEAKHIWPVIAGVTADAADPMPALGKAHPMPKTRVIGP
jgi:hypothetical protein